jgi:hypothetical protein
MTAAVLGGGGCCCAVDTPAAQLVRAYKVHLPIERISTLSSSRGVSCLCQKVALYVVEQTIVVILDPAALAAVPYQHTVL